MTTPSDSNRHEDTGRSKSPEKCACTPAGSRGQSSTPGSPQIAAHVQAASHSARRERARRRSLSTLLFVGLRQACKRISICRSIGFSVWINGSHVIFQFPSGAATEEQTRASLHVLSHPHARALVCVFVTAVHRHDAVPSLRIAGGDLLLFSHRPARKRVAQKRRRCRHMQEIGWISMRRSGKCKMIRKS